MPYFGDIEVNFTYGHSITLLLELNAGLKYTYLKTRFGKNDLAKSSKRHTGHEIKYKNVNNSEKGRNYTGLMFEEQGHL